MPSPLPLVQFLPYPFALYNLLLQFVVRFSQFLPYPFALYNLLLQFGRALLYPFFQLVVRFSQSLFGLLARFDVQECTDELTDIALVVAWDKQALLGKFWVRCVARYTDI